MVEFPIVKEIGFDDLDLREINSLTPDHNLCMFEEY